MVMKFFLASHSTCYTYTLSDIIHLQYCLFHPHSITLFHITCISSARVSRVELLKCQEKGTLVVMENAKCRGINKKVEKINRFEPLNTLELMASPMTVSCFQNVGCFDFFERIQPVKNHFKLTRLFIINLHDKQFNLAGVTFELSLDSIANAIGIPSVGEKWFKQASLDISYREPYLKTQVQRLQ